MGFFNRSDSKKPSRYNIQEATAKLVARARRNYITKLNRHIATFAAQPTDTKKWEWIRDNQDGCLTIYLTEDSTFAHYESYRGEHTPMVFDKSLGTSYGVEVLLEGLGIKYEIGK